MRHFFERASAQAVFGQVSPTLDSPVRRIVRVARAAHATCVAPAVSVLQGSQTAARLDVKRECAALVLRGVNVILALPTPCARATRAFFCFLVSGFHVDDVLDRASR